MKHNLIYTSKFCKMNKTSVEFLPSSFHMKDLQTGAILIHGRTKDGVYEWPTKPPTSIIAFSNVKASPFDWLHRLRHPYKPILQHLISHYKLHTVFALSSSFHYKDCFYNKSLKLPFSQSSIVSSAPLQIIFYDVWISPIQLIDNFKYYVVFVDHFSYYIWLYPLKRKSDVSLIYLASNHLLKFSSNKKLLLFSRIMGVNTQVCPPFIATHGISHHTSPPHTRNTMVSLKVAIVT